MVLTEFCDNMCVCVCVISDLFRNLIFLQMFPPPKISEKCPSGSALKSEPSATNELQVITIDMQAY